LLSTPVGRFRAIAFVEGVSYLVLLLIAMPIKYVPALGGHPEPTRIVGAIHGGLFILYAIAGFQAKAVRGWPMSEVVRGFVAAVMPLGTFFYDAWFLRREQEAERAGREPVASDLQSHG
jgi:integral membrane protein